MPRVTTFAVVLATMFIAISCQVGEAGTVGYWPFDSDLRDISGAGHHGEGEAMRFSEGEQGEALDLNWQRVQIPDSDDLHLAPGLTIDCWVYFEEKPKGYNQIVMKDKEYQLRVDGEREGGQFALFVYLNGWEPRVRGPVPEPGRWHHLVAQWTGTHISLEVDGKKSSAGRTGSPIPVPTPLCVGPMLGKVDELKIVNPQMRILQQVAEAAQEVADEDRIDRSEFVGQGSWEAWTAGFGTTTQTQQGRLKAALDEASSMVYHPALAVDVTNRKYLSLDVGSDTADHITVVFATDRGTGTVTMPIWDVERTTIIDLRDNPRWTGTLRLLGIAIPDDGPHTLTVERICLADKPRGKPFVYVRNLAPGRAILRAGREEKIIAIVRSPGPDAEGVRATLEGPPGLSLLDEPSREIGAMAHDATERLEWRIRADEPLTGPVRLTLSVPGGPTDEAGIDVSVRPPVDAPPASYVPEPRPAKTDYLALMHYCPLWKFGTHYGWGRIEDWPDRRPAIGWYDEGTPEVADWHIKYALEHGIQAFIYCWYRSNWGPDVKHSLGHAIHDGLLKARYLDKFKFCIMWENGCAKGVQSPEDMMQNLFPYWMKNYFTHPSYLVVDNKPVLFVWRPERVGPELGGIQATRDTFEKMRQECKQAGFDGLYIIGCVGSGNEDLLNRMARESWDASSAYGIGGPTIVPPARDPEGIVTTPHQAWLEGQRKTLLEKRRIGALPDIVDVMAGWDPRPWHRQNTNSYIAGVSPENFKTACINAKEIIDATAGNGLDKRLVVFDNWNEFGEGHYIEPCCGYGFGFLDAIRDVFCDDSEPCHDVIPEDVGLEPPEHVYANYKRIMTGAGAGRKTTGDLVASWSFDHDEGSLTMDDSGSRFHAFRLNCALDPGLRGKALRCTGGAVSHGPREEFWPDAGISIELWCKPDIPAQSDRWMINTVGRADSGYRLGMTGGKIAWQVPLSNWSHLLSAPEPLAVGEWSHVAATYDNEALRLFINGEPVGQLARGGPIRPSGAALSLGTFRSGHPTAFFSGWLDEVRIYNRPLSAEEVRQRYTDSAP